MLTAAHPASIKLLKAIAEITIAFRRIVYILKCPVQIPLDTEAKIMEYPAVSGIAAPLPEIPLCIILFGGATPMVSGIAVPPSECPPLVSFLRSVQVHEAGEGADELGNAGEISPPGSAAVEEGNGANGKPSAPLPG